jgi:integrase/recombinase XerD
VSRAGPGQAYCPGPAWRAWDDLAAWWLSRFKPSTQATWALLLPRWTSWCAEHGIEPLAARRPDVERGCSSRRLRPVPLLGRRALRRRRLHLPLAWRKSSSTATRARGSARPKVHRELQRREVLTVLEYAAFLHTARELGPNEHAIAVLAGMMGLRASEMAGLTVESLSVVRGYSTLTFIGKGDKPARVPVPIPALAAVQAAVDGRTTGPLLRTRTGRGMDRRAVHAYVAGPRASPGSAGPSPRTRCAAPSAPRR